MISVIRYGYQYQVPEYQYQDTNFPQLDIDDQSSLDGRPRLEKKQDRVRLGGHLIMSRVIQLLFFIYSSLTNDCYSVPADVCMIL